MPAKRVRKRIRRLNVRPPQWATNLLHGQLPRPNSGEWHEFCGWCYFGREIVGLQMVNRQKVKSCSWPPNLGRCDWRKLGASSVSPVP
jgi:hypothetical protein